jgi:hypothetical protein
MMKLSRAKEIICEVIDEERHIEGAMEREAMRVLREDESGEAMVEEYSDMLRSLPGIAIL